MFCRIYLGSYFIAFATGNLKYNDISCGLKTHGKYVLNAIQKKRNYNYLFACVILIF